jgi:hypothetical protein
MEFDLQYQMHKIPSWSEYYFEYQEMNYILNKYFKKHQFENICQKKEGSIKSPGVRRDEQIPEIQVSNEANYKRDYVIEIGQKSESIKSSYSILAEDQPINLEKFKIDFHEKINRVDEFFVGMFNDLNSDYNTIKQSMMAHQNTEHIGLNEVK